LVHPSLTQLPLPSAKNNSKQDMFSASLTTMHIQFTPF